MVKMPEAQFKYDFYFSNEKKHTLEKFCTLVFTKNRLFSQIKERDCYMEGNFEALKRSAVS